jgi:hypothetical protein
MQSRLVFVAAAALLSLGACNKKPSVEGNSTAPAPAPAAPTPAPAATMPPRTPGLWAQTVSAAGHTQTMRLCLDKALEQRFTAWGQHSPNEHSTCTPAVVTPHLGGGWDFQSSCRMGEGGTSETKGSVTGDFAKSYTLTATTTISGAAAPQMNGTHEMKMEAHWEGPCPAGVEPGDMVMANGMKINIAKAPGG